MTLKELQELRTLAEKARIANPDNFPLMSLYNKIVDYCIDKQAELANG